MANFLSALMQVLLFTCGPLLFFGIVFYFCRALFAFLVGEREGRRLQLLAFAPSSPLRELAHIVAATLFLHRVTDAAFLQLRDPDGELGFVEHSYNPRNPLALLGNFVYALAPLVLGLFGVFLVTLTCFGDVLPQFLTQFDEIAAVGGGFGDYASAALALLPAMLGAQTPVPVKILGFSCLLLFCMGLFVSVQELLEGISGALLYLILAALFCAMLMLFDVRVQRVMLGGLHSFAAGVTALCLIVLLAIAALLLLAGVFFLFRILFLTGGGEGERTQALQIYRENENKP